MKMFGRTKDGVGLSAGEGPSVYVVDSYATRPPLPPRLNQQPRRSGASQTLLFLLVSLALCGVVIEACFIYQLHHSQSISSPIASKLTAGGEVNSPRKPVRPSKPVAHLTGGQDAVHGKKTMSWSLLANPILKEMGYRNRGLIIQKEGYYFVYSKVFFTDNGTFYHSVEKETDKYAGGFIPLLQSRKYSPRSDTVRSNSFLGGVFKLEKNDALYVKVSDKKKLVLHKSIENVFGAFMI